MYVGCVRDTYLGHVQLGTSSITVHGLSSPTTLLVGFYEIVDRTVQKIARPCSKNLSSVPILAGT